MLFATLLLSATFTPLETQTAAIRPTSNHKVSQLYERLNPFQLMHGEEAEQFPTDIQNYMISEKLDGVRGFWDGHAMWSRQGLEIKIPQRIKSKLPLLPIHGELWAGRGSFSFVSGLIHRDDPTRPEWEEVKFAVFDVSISIETFKERYDRLAKIPGLNSQDDSVFLIPQFTVNSIQEIRALFQDTIRHGGEGLMLHHQNNLYSPGRTSQLLKYKPTNNMRVDVIGYKEGNGKYRNVIGSLKVRNEQGQEFYVGSGLTDLLRQNPPDLGTTICIEHTGLTTHDLPRFPRFKRIC